MGVAGTLLIYAVVGVAVAVASVLKCERLTLARGTATAIGAAIFWPIFLPFLFADPVGRAPKRTVAPSQFDARIAHGEARLSNALASLEGVAEDLLAPQRERIRVLGDGLRAMARRSAEMEALLTTPEFDGSRTEAALRSLESSDDPRAASLRTRQRNVERLRQMHTKTVEDLERALLSMEAIGSQMVLLKFVEDPDGEALRLLEELAMTVDGATEGLAA
jgi:hypothetical protein